jgi:polyphosphate glucokinase
MKQLLSSFAGSSGEACSGRKEEGGLRIGIDVGGSGIKAGIVDTATGILAAPAVQVPTPHPASPEAVAGTIAGLVDTVSAWSDESPTSTPVGVALPAIVHKGVARSAANIGPGWVGLNVESFLRDRLNREVRALNDADAAGLAEIRYGAGRGVSGTVLMITLGTGIGSALVFDGRLVPNTELGHLELDGVDAETRASAVVRDRDGLDWDRYAERIQRYLAHLEFLLSPDLIVVGGGISACSENFLPGLRLDTPVVPARLQNTAGIAGAGLHAATYASV